MKFLRYLLAALLLASFASPVEAGLIQRIKARLANRPHILAAPMPNPSPWHNPNNGPNPWNWIRPFIPTPYYPQPVAPPGYTYALVNGQWVLVPTIQSTK